MPTLETTANLTSVADTVAAPVGKAVTTLDQILAAPLPASGTSSGNDALTDLLAKLDEDDLLDVRTNLLQATATTKWFVWVSTENRLYVKTRTGSPGSYTYGYTPAFTPGDYQLRLIYHTSTDATAPAYGITWNAANQTFNVTSGGWTLAEAGANWFRVVVLPAASDTISVSPGIRVGSPPASAIAYTRPNTSGLFPAAVTDVGEALDYVNDNLSRTSTPAPTSQDDSLIQTEEWGAQDGALGGIGTNVRQSFTLDSALRDFQSNYGGRIFAEAVVTITTQATVADPTPIMRFRFAILDGAGNALSAPITGTLPIRAQIGTVERSLRISGNLPAGFTGGRWQVTVDANPVNSDAQIPGIAGVTRVRLEMRSDVKSDEVIVLSDDTGANISNDVMTQSDFNQEVDELPLELADTNDPAFPASPNGIDDNNIWVVRDFPISQNIVNRNGRELQTFVARLRYNSNYIVGSRSPQVVQTVSYEHRVWANLPDEYIGAPLTQMQSNTLDGLAYELNQRVDNQGATPTLHTGEVTIPSNATSLSVGFKSDANQSDADLAITNYEFDFEKGIDASGFTGNLDTNTRSTQTLASKVDTLSVGGASTASAVSIVNSQFYNPTNVIGGLREPLPTGLSRPGLVASPTNAQEAFTKTDYMLSLAYNPYQWTQNLDRLPGGTLTEDFPVSGSGFVVSNPIDVPELFRDISEDLIVRVRVNAAVEPSGFRGRLRIVTSNDNNVNVTGTSPVSINGGLSSQAQGQDIVTQQRIPAASVPSTFQIRLEGTGTNTENATFNNGHVYLEVASGDESTGQMGQAVSWNEVIIWTAGLTTTARLTNSNVQTLLAGNTWAQYHWLHFNFDNGTNDGMLFPMVVLATQFRASANYGTFVFSNLYGYNVIPHGSGDNQFRFIWNGAGTKGLRRIIGVSIS